MFVNKHVIDQNNGNYEFVRLYLPDKIIIMICLLKPKMFSHQITLSYADELFPTLSDKFNVSTNFTRD